MANNPLPQIFNSSAPALAPIAQNPQAQPQSDGRIAKLMKSAGSSLVEGAQQKIEKEVEPIKQRFLDAFMAPVPKPLADFYTFSKKIIQTPDQVTFDEFNLNYRYLTELLANNNKLLLEFAPKLNEQGIAIFRNAKNFLSTFTDANMFLAFPAAATNRANEVTVKHFNTALEEIANINSGAFIQLANYASKQFSENGDFSISHGIEKVKLKCDEVLKAAKDGLKKELSADKDTYINQFFAHIKEKCVGKEATFDANGRELTSKQTGLIEWFGTKASEEMDVKLIGLNNPLITDARSKSIQLEGALKERQFASVKKLSRELDTQLTAILSKEAEIFKKIPLKEDDRIFLNLLLNRLKRVQTIQESALDTVMQSNWAQKAAETLGSYDGVGVRILDVVNQKIFGENGFLPRIEKRFAIELDKALEHIDKRFTKEAHPVLTAVRQKAFDLREALVRKNAYSIVKKAKELEELLKQFETSRTNIFAEGELQPDDLSILMTLKKLLPNLYNQKPLPIADMLVEIEKAILSIEPYYSAHAGIAAKTGAVFKSYIGSAVDPLIDIVQDAKKAFNSAVGKPAEDAESSDNDSSSASGENTAAQFMQLSGNFLKNLIEKGGKGVSKAALKQWSKVMIFGIDHILAHMGEGRGLESAKAALNGLKSNLTAELDNNSEDIWSRLTATYNNFTGILSTLNQDVRLYLNGFRMPRFGSSSTMTTEKADGLFLNNLNKLDEAKIDPAVQLQNADWKDQADIEKIKLVSNTSLFLSLQFIYEKVCKLNPSDVNLYAIMQKAVNIHATTPDEAIKKCANAEEEVKELFFAQLAEKKVNFFRILLSKAFFFFSSKILHHLVSNAITVYFAEIFNYIDNFKTAELDSLRQMVITNSTRYLTILGGAYKRIAYNPEPTRTIEEMLSKELARPESNLYHKPSDLYESFTASVLKKATGSGFITWVVKKFISFFFGSPEKIVESVFEKILSNVQGTRGYTHALNTVIREQLDEIWNILKTDSQKNEDGSVHKKVSEYSDAQRNQLTGLVKNLFSILQQSKCQLPKELQDLLEGKDTGANFNQALDHLFIEDVIENITNILAIAIQTLVNKDQLTKLTYKFAKLANRTYEEGAPVDLETMKAEERNIAERCESILRLSIDNAVNEKFDFTGAKQQNETNRRIDDLRKYTSKHVEKVQQALQGIGPETDFTDATNSGKITTLYVETVAFNKECFEASLKAKTARLNSDNKSAINKNYHAIGQKAQELADTVAQIKKHSMTLDLITKIDPECNAIKLILDVIPVTLFLPTGPAANAIQFCEEQIHDLESHLGKLDAMSIKIKDCDLTKLSEFCLDNSRGDSPIERIVKARSEQPDPKDFTTGLKLQFDNLRAAIAALKIDETQVDNDYCNKLLSELNKIETATDTNEIEIAYQEFYRQIRYGHLFLLHDKIYKAHNELPLIMRDLKNALNVKAFSSAQLQPNSLLENIVNIKKNNPVLGRLGKDFRTKIVQLKNEIQLSCEPVLMGSLLQLCKKIEDATQANQVELAYQEFLALLRQTLIQADNAFNDLNRKYFDAARGIRAAIDDAPLLNRNQSGLINQNMRALVDNTREQLMALNEWKINEVKDEPYHNIALVDLKWAKDWAGGIVYDRVRERLDGLIAFLKRDDTWRYGLLNHLFLIPYTDKLAKEESGG